LNRNGNVITPVGASSDPITAGDIMFRRKWIWFGKLVSDEGFTLEYGYKTIRYTDERGTFMFG
jgi:hypothetical protein